MKEKQEIRNAEGSIPFQVLISTVSILMIYNVAEYYGLLSLALINSVISKFRTGLHTKTFTSADYTYNSYML